MSSLATFTTRPSAIASVAHSLQARDDTRAAMRRVFIEALRFSNARSTPKVPTSFWLNVAADGEPNSFELRLRMVPITELIGEMADKHWFIESLCTSLREISIGTVRDAMVETYIEGNLDQLIALEWKP